MNFNLRQRRPVITAVQRQRERERKSAFSRAKDSHEEASRRSGAYFIGMDENGLAKEAREPKRLRIVADKWYVSMSFKREDRKRLAGKSLSEVEDRLKEGTVQRRIVRFNTHIITAVRALKHVREGYEAEMARTRLLLNQLDALNIYVADMNGKLSNSDIDGVNSWLRSFGESELAKKQVAVKKIVASARLSKTIEMLEQARELPLQKRALQVMGACAVFTSLRDRLGKWRDEEIAGIAEYNHQRECALRVERNKWLFSQLVKFAEIPEQVYAFQAYDAQKVEVLETIRGMLKAKSPRDSILGYIKDKSGLFKVAGRERENAEQMVALMEAGVQPKDKRKTDYLIGHYRSLYRHVKRRENTKAMTKLDYLLLFVDSNKPRFILEELQKDPDRCLKSVLPPFQKAVEAYEAQDFKTAKRYFAQAAKRVRRMMQPKRR